MGRRHPIRIETREWRVADIDSGDVEEIEQAEELVARVAAIDIAKASGMVCVRLPHEETPGKRV